MMISRAENKNTQYSTSFILFLGWTFILIGRPQDIFPILAPFRPALTFAIITLMVIVMSNKRFSLQDLFETSESKKYTLLLLIMILGIPFAYHRRVAFHSIFPMYILTVLFFYLFLVQVDSLKKLKSIIFTLCLSTLFYSVFALSKGSFSSGRFWFGTMHDPNDLAYFLVSLFPLSFIFIGKGDGPAKKLAAALTIATSLCVILLTGSRGGFVGLIAVLCLILFSKLASIKRSHKIVILACLPIMLLFFGGKIDVERYMSLTQIKNDYNITSLTGRLEIWKRGIKLTLSHPITGVGLNCFPKALGGMKAAERLPSAKWQVAHNSYLQMSAETGLIGFAVFLSLIIGCIKNFLNCSRLDTSNPDLQKLKPFGGAFLVGFTGNLICGFFLAQGYSIIFTAFFALSAAIRKLYSSFEDINKASSA